MCHEFLQHLCEVCIVCLFLVPVIRTLNINVSCGNLGEGVRRIAETLWGSAELLRLCGGPQNFCDFVGVLRIAETCGVPRY